MGHREPHGMYTVSTPLRLMFMQIAWHLGRGAGAENLGNLRLTLEDLQPGPLPLGGSCFLMAYPLLPVCTHM